MRLAEAEPRRGMTLTRLMSQVEIIGLLDQQHPQLHYIELGGDVIWRKPVTTQWEMSWVR